MTNQDGSAAFAILHYLQQELRGYLFRACCDTPIVLGISMHSENDEDGEIAGKFLEHRVTHDGDLQTIARDSNGQEVVLQQGLATAKLLVKYTNIKGVKQLLRKLPNIPPPPEEFEGTAITGMLGDLAESTQ